MTEPTRPPLAPLNGYQRFLATLFLLAVVCMATQYAYVRHGKGRVIISPIGRATPEQIEHEDRDQPPGVYLLDYNTLDQTAYKLHQNTFWSAAELLTPLLFVLALPLVFILGPRRLAWPRWPAVFLWLLMLVSCLAAYKFGEAAKKTVQFAVVLLVTPWLAAAVLPDAEQLKRLNRWLAGIAVVVLLMACYEYWRYVYQPPFAAQMPTSVRATCASRSAFCGLMVMLLSLGFARVLASGNPLGMLGWIALCVIGVGRLMNAGAVLALLIAWIAMCAVKGKWGWVTGLVLVPLGFVGAMFLTSPRQHLDHLRASIDVYTRENGWPVGVEKRYLEMAAAMNGLTATRDVTAQGEDSATNGELTVAGQFSNLVTGVGPGLNYQWNIGEYYGGLDNPKKQEPDTYNLYLLLAVQMGLFAAVAWAWILFDGASVARRAYERHTDPGLKTFALGIFGACLGLILFSLFGTILVRGTSLMLFTLLGAAYRLDWLARAEAAVPAKPVKPVKAKPVAAPAAPPQATVATGAESGEVIPEAERVTPADEPAAAVDEPHEDLETWLRKQGLLDDEAKGEGPKGAG